MIHRHLVLICLAISTAFLFIAVSLYPGGSLQDPGSQGFDWTKNFFSNLFEEKALNGAANKARIWAIAGMAFHASGYGLFFLHTSQKMPDKNAALLLKYIALVNILFTILIATPLHDMMVTLSSTISLLGVFYITVYAFKTKLHFFKLCCVLCMLTFYFTLFLYGVGNWGLLAVMQKVSMACSLLLVLGIEYFIKKADFVPLKQKA